MIEEEEQDLDPRTPEVFDKYRTSGDITSRVLAKIVSACTPGKKIVDLCSEGDKLIEEETAKVFGKKKIEKGIAFPTCISINNCAGHFSPLSSDATVLSEGDLVKVDLGTHIDGFIAQAAHSFVCTTSKEPVTGNKADAICAAYFAAEAALRLFKPGKTNTDITAAIAKVAEDFKVNPVEGVLSHQTKRFVIDGNNTVINKQTLEQKVEEVTFEEWDVFIFDLVVSTGEGKLKELDARTTVYKRNVDQNYSLKMRTSREVFAEINKRFPTVPFTIRSLKDENKSKLGITECLKHDLLEGYPVLFEKPTEFVAQFKFTAMITPTQTLRLTSHPQPLVRSEYAVTDPELKSLLASGTKRNAPKKSKKKGKKKTTAAKKEEQPTAAADAAAAETSASS